MRSILGCRMSLTPLGRAVAFANIEGAPDRLEAILAEAHERGANQAYCVGNLVNSLTEMRRLGAAVEAAEALLRDPAESPPRPPRSGRCPIDEGSRDCLRIMSARARDGVARARFPYGSIVIGGRNEYELLLHEHAAGRAESDFYNELLLVSGRTIVGVEDSRTFILSHELEDWVESVPVECADEIANERTRTPEGSILERDGSARGYVLMISNVAVQQVHRRRRGQNGWERLEDRRVQLLPDESYVVAPSSRGSGFVLFDDESLELC